MLQIAVSAQLFTQRIMLCVHYCLAVKQYELIMEQFLGMRSRAKMDNWISTNIYFRQNGDEIL